MPYFKPTTSPSADDATELSPSRQKRIILWVGEQLNLYVYKLIILASLLYAISRITEKKKYKSSSLIKTKCRKVNVRNERGKPERI